MKVLKTSQNILETDCQWLSKSFNTSRFSCSRIFLIQTEKDYQFISANLLDRIVAFCQRFFGRTYESSFAKKLQVNSVKILDRKTYDLECQKARGKAEQILPPPVPRVDLAAVGEAARKEARRDAMRANLQQDATLQSKFSDAQKACANNIVAAFFTAPKSDAAVSLEVNLPAESRNEVMDYLVQKRHIAAWAQGSGNRIYVKGRAGDSVDFQNVRLDWKDQQVLGNERKFQESNRIGFFHQESYNALKQSPLSRGEILLMLKLILQLNRRGGYGPYQLSDATQGTENCLRYLKDHHMIHDYRQDQGKWIVSVTARDAGQNPLTLQVPPSFLPKQKDAVLLALTRLATNRQQNYPHVYDLVLNQLTSDMIQQVMDYLLLQGEITGWEERRGLVHLTASPNTNLPPTNGSWRVREDAQRDQESCESRRHQIYSLQLEDFEHSALSRDELINFAQLINM